MRNLMIALVLTLVSLFVPAFTLVACADAESHSVGNKVVERTADREIKSVTVRHDPNLGTVKVTVYVSREVNL